VRERERDNFHELTLYCVVDFALLPLLSYKSHSMTLVSSINKEKSEKYTNIHSSVQISKGELNTLSRFAAQLPEYKA
jgi:hypothetical protein